MQGCQDLNGCKGRGTHPWETPVWDYGHVPAVPAAQAGWCWLPMGMSEGLFFPQRRGAVSCEQAHPSCLASPWPRRFSSLQVPEPSRCEK